MAWFMAEGIQWVLLAIGLVWIYFAGIYTANKVTLIYMDKRPIRWAESFKIWGIIILGGAVVAMSFWV